MDWTQFTTNALFSLLGVCILVWLIIYRRLNPHDLQSSPYYRWHQVLIALIALLAILVSIVVMFSIDADNTGDYMLWP